MQTSVGSEELLRLLSLKSLGDIVVIQVKKTKIHYQIVFWWPLWKEMPESYSLIHVPEVQVITTGQSQRGNWHNLVPNSNKSLGAEWIKNTIQSSSVVSSHGCFPFKICLLKSKIHSLYVHFIYGFFCSAKAYKFD